MSNGKIYNFDLFPMFGFTLVIKLTQTFDFESHGNTIICFHKKVMPDLNMSYQTLFDLL